MITDTFLSVKKPVWADEKKSQIKFSVILTDYPDEEVDFVASKDDVVEYSKELFAQAVSGEYGEISSYIPPSDEVYAAHAREERFFKLAETDWTQLPDVLLSQEEKEKWTIYRQELRDISLQDGFPKNIIWPTKP